MPRTEWKRLRNKYLNLQRKNMAHSKMRLKQFHDQQNDWKKPRNFGTGANDGKVVAVDFQVFGKGLVSVELIYLMGLIGLLKNYEEYEEFLRGRFSKISFFLSM